MDQIEKVKVFALLAAGRRQEALGHIRDKYRVSDEEANRLLQALESESPVKGINRQKLVRWAGLGVFLFGIICLGIGASRYFVYESNDERQMTTITCTVADVRELADGTEVTFAYTYNGQSYTTTERSEAFRDLGFSRGQEIELLINVGNPQVTLLPALKPAVQASGLRYGGMGLILVLISIVIWTTSLKRGVRS